MADYSTHPAPAEGEEDNRPPLSISRVSYHEVEVPRGPGEYIDIELPKACSLTPVGASFNTASSGKPCYLLSFIMIQTNIDDRNS